MRGAGLCWQRLDRAAVEASGHSSVKGTYRCPPRFALVKEGLITNHLSGLMFIKFLTRAGG